jgi:dTDP-glucose pyrophosphorylase
MQRPVAESIKELRKEIAEISDANRKYIKDGKRVLETNDQERRLQRLQEILDELVKLTEWKKT